MSLSQLLTKYVNELFVVTREVKNPVSGAVTIAADYSHLGGLFLTVTAIGLVLPMAAILVVKTTRFRSA